MKLTPFPSSRFWIASALFCGAVSLVAVHAQEPAAPPKKQQRTRPAFEITAADRVTIDTARERAATMHAVYAAALETMHHHYFHGEKAAVPARALEDTFDTIRRQSKVEARWIAVNSPAMSIDHEPETDFEKTAARKLSQGAERYERIEDGYYRRAGTIPLHGGCIRCHMNTFGPPPKVAKFAGLIISVPVHTIDSDSVEAHKPGDSTDAE